MQEVIADRTKILRDKGKSDKETFRVESVTQRIEGTASLRDMSVVFTCTKHGCVIYCPCTVCHDARTSINTCNTSLAAKGALANRLQRLQNPKWPPGGPQNGRGCLPLGFWAF